MKVDYSSKYNGSYPIDNITKVLNEHLPKMYLTNQDSFIDSVKTDHIQFKPIGEKIHEYTREVKHGNEYFEIYKVKREKKENQRQTGRFNFLTRVLFPAKSLESTMHV